MEKPLLTIAIPTYNHHNYLQKQLESLIPQLGERIEFLIIDNHSDIDVQKFINKELPQFKNIKIYRNSSNIGGDNNILKCFELAKGKFLWPLSDNDIVLENSVNVVISMLLSNPVSLFHNFGNNSNFKTQGFIDYCKNVPYGNAFTISNCIYNLEKLKPFLKYYRKFINTHMGQEIIVLKYLEQNPTTQCFFYDVNLFSEMKPATWSKKQFVVDSLNIYSAFKNKSLYFFQKTIGKQLLGIQLNLLILARVNNELKRNDLLSLLYLIFRKTNKIQFLNKKIFKLLLIYSSLVVCPSLYIFYLKKQNHKLIKLIKGVLK